MDLFVNHKANKENNNPVLVPSQFEILSKEGVFNKTNNLLYPQNRFHYRKPRYSITQMTQQQPVIGHSNSSQSIHKEIEKIAKQLQSQQMHTMTQTSFSQTIKERHPTQHSQQSNNTQVTEMMELLEKENLLRIQQIKPSTPRRAYTPQVNYHLPPLLSENKSHYQDSSEKVTPQLRSYQIFKRTNPSHGEFKKISQVLENRQKRTTSQVLQTQIPQKQIPMKERINKVLQNSHKILSLCKRVPEIQEQMSEPDIMELIQSDHFKIELQHLINNSVKGTSSQIELILQNFMIEQVRKHRELIEIENVLQEKKQNFCVMLNNYIQELKQKL